MSLKKLRAIADALNREYLRAGGVREIDLGSEAIRIALRDTVSTAFDALEKLNRGAIPDCLLHLLPNDDARFEMQCRTQPDGIPVEIEAPAFPAGCCQGCGYRYVTAGETCPNCDHDDDTRPAVTQQQPPSPARHHKPKPAEGFQYCPFCHVGDALVGGGHCSNCGEYVDPHESTFPGKL